VNFDGPSFYDDDAIFASYSKRRNRPESPNNTLEHPVVAELLGEPAGLEFLDLGCGDGQFGLNLLAQGASAYLGVDGSQNMISAATERLRGTAGVVQQSRLEDLSLPANRFNRVSARLVLHYLQDLSPVFNQVSQTLKDNGLFVFSVEHPVITSSSLAATESGTRENWIVDNYFSKGTRTTRWLGGDIVKYHRTVEDYFAAVQSAGLRVEALRESAPRIEHFADRELFLRRCRIPLFLIIAARKPPRTDA
jgi:ubiquinone/menaquinone biosynthesis C-methylase UbiE